MRFTSLLHRDVAHRSVVWRESHAIPGVRYAIRRISLAQRIELTRSLRDLCLKHEFLKAGDEADHLEASLSNLLVRKLYLEWGLAAIGGLSIDGQSATLGSVIANGPEELTEEMIESIKSELGLSEDERKNS